MIPGMETRILCQSAGWVLFEHGRRLVFADRGTSYRRVLLFVLALLAVIAGCNGLVWLMAGMRSGEISRLGTGLIGTAAVAGLVGWWLWEADKRERATLPARDAWIAVVDLDARTFETPGGELLAPLTEVRFAPALQLASSSRALAATWPGGSMVVYRGSPFGGSFRDALDALRRHGVESAE